MSTELIPLNVEVPAHIMTRERRGRALDALLPTSSVPFPRISIKASRFRLVEGKSETVLSTPHLDVVVVAVNPKVSKTYYASAYNESEEAKGPLCASKDGIRPDKNIEDPQNDLCATCPHNVWGSASTGTGKPTTSCKSSRRLAVVSADAPDGPIYLLEVAASAFTDLKDYSRELKLRNFDLEVVRTRISFDPKASYPKLKFKFAGFLDEATIAAVDDRLDDPKIMQITGAATDENAEVPAVAEKPKPLLVTEAPKVVQPVAAARGFASAPAAPAAPKPAVKAKPAPAPAPAPAADSLSLADEIAALVNGLQADDA